MKTALLAIVIPYYNIHYFEETLKSVAAQSNKNFRLYIGNDASPHDPLTLIQKYFKEGEYLYYAYQDNVGGKNLALQWERILENVTEEWFQILGDDDMISENFVEAFYNCLPSVNAKNISAIKFTHEWVDEENKTLEVFDYKSTTISAVHFFIKKYRNEVKSSLSENIFQTKMLKKYGFEKIPLAWGSDDLALLCFSNFGTIQYNQNSKVLVRISSSSISGSELMDKEKSSAYNFFRQTVITKYVKYFPKEFAEEIISDYLYYCHKNKHSAQYSVANYYLMHGRSVKYLRCIKQIYYINQMAHLK